MSNLLLFLHLDSGVPQGVTQQVTHKVAQHLTGTSHGDNVKLLNSMIQVRALTNPLIGSSSSHRTCGVSSYDMRVPVSCTGRLLELAFCESR